MVYTAVDLSHFLHFFSSFIFLVGIALIFVPLAFQELCFFMQS